ncbi:hypothetical protein [Caryophanon latum]
MTAIDTKQQQIMLRSGKCIPVSRRLMKQMKAFFKETRG